MPLFTQLQCTCDVIKHVASVSRVLSSQVFKEIGRHKEKTGTNTFGLWPKTCI